MTSIAVAALTGFFVYGGVAGMTTENLLQAKAPAEPTYVPEEYTVSITGYNAVPEQTDDTPTITGSGAWTNPEVIAARSADLREELPYGTVIAFSSATTTPNCGYSYVQERIGLRVVADAMNPRLRNKIDILFDTEERIPAQEAKMRNPAKALGICKDVVITVVGHVEIKNIPKTQLELAAAVGFAPLALRR